ncbi:DUF4783 domain-containing protein [Mucilaginibacter mali]|uniref:DUF4783 domain-containing protein n=1 Tax=Mucilaginibacter mali TaxID=2740462 RepID=A0A7D4TWC1_9SPHI|nr:DUF4783 domain-containing protein [Mucilaginibacter mali]QKJ29337.1 DUF4783 domain-containing protein [Mucilaginibacter mali]
MMTRLFIMLLYIMPIGHTAPGPIDNAADLIKANNIHKLAEMFAPTVEITILNEENIYSAAQAEVVLQNFFKANPVKSMQIVHRVNSNPIIRYAVLQLVTANGTYRTSISLKQVDGKFLLNEIKVETDKKG